MKWIAKWVAIAAILVFDTTKENEITEQHMDTLEGELTARAQKITDLENKVKEVEQTVQTLQGEKATLTEEKTSLNTKLNEAQNNIKTLTEENESLKVNPGTQFDKGKPAKETGVQKDSDADLKFFEENAHDTAACVAKLRGK